MIDRVVVLGVVVAGVLATGCASGRVAQEVPDAPDPLAAQAAPAGDGAEVHVQSHNWQDLDVFAVVHGTRSRLGTVTSMSAADMRLPAAVLAGSPNIQIFITPIASRSGYLTQSIVVNPGQTVDLRVENNLNLTSYSVW